MKGARKFRQRLEKDLKKPGFKKAFDEQEVFANVAIQMSKIRDEEGLTQKDLAKALHTSQQSISRLESLNNRSCSLRTLIKVAHALHRDLEIRFV